MTKDVLYQSLNAAQNPFVSLPNTTSEIQKNKIAEDQYNNKREKNNPSLNEDVESADYGPPNYQSSVVQQNVESNFDAESVKGFHFNDESIRRNFIRKVFTFLSVND